jgi:hypothetical protein
MNEGKQVVKIHLTVISVSSKWFQQDCDVRAARKKKNCGRNDSLLERKKLTIELACVVENTRYVDVQLSFNVVIDSAHLTELFQV